MRLPESFASKQSLPRRLAILGWKRQEETASADSLLRPSLSSRSAVGASERSSIES
jgi:hypothetical protein